MLKLKEKKRHWSALWRAFWLLLLVLWLPGLLRSAAPSWSIEDASAKNEAESNAAVSSKTALAKSSVAVTANNCNRLLRDGGVFIFFDPSCPVCAEYLPTIERLRDKYGRKQPFYLVFRQCDLPAISRFINDYHPRSSILGDGDSILQEKLGAKVTPEAFLVKDGSTLYSGRIDDRYHSIGNRRSIIGRHDLELSLEAVEQGKLPEPESTRAVGCIIELGTPGQSLETRSEGLERNAEVARHECK